MSQHRKKQSDRACGKSIKRHVRMRGDSGEQTTSAGIAKTSIGQSLRRLDCMNAEAHQGNRMARQLYRRPEDLRDQLVCVPHETREQFPVRMPIWPECRTCLVDRSVQDCRWCAIEWVCQTGW